MRECGERSGTVSAANHLAAVPPSGPPHYARLFVGDVRYDAVEFSAAGLSLARWAARRGKLGTLERGEECAATLCLGGLGWEESYEVTVRFAVRGPSHLGLAFVALPPGARQRLSQEAEESDLDDVLGDAGLGHARQAPFAFARLADDEKETPGRRLILSASAAVLALTRSRSEDNGTGSKSVDDGLASAARLESPASDEVQSRAGTLFVYGIALFALLVVFLGVVFG